MVLHVMQRNHITGALLLTYPTPQPIGASPISCSLGGKTMQSAELSSRFFKMMLDTENLILEKLLGMYVRSYMCFDLFCTCFYVHHFLIYFKLLRCSFIIFYIETLYLFLVPCLFFIPVTPITFTIRPSVLSTSLFSFRFLFFLLP